MILLVAIAADNKKVLLIQTVLFEPPEEFIAFMPKAADVTMIVRLA